MQYDDTPRMNTTENARRMLDTAAETVHLLTQEKDRAVAERVISRCRQWLAEQTVSGAELLDLLDNETDGITYKEEAAADPTERAVWNCIVDAAAYTARLAYEAEQCRFLPEPLEMADASVLPHFEACYRECKRRDHHE